MWRMATLIDHILKLTEHRDRDLLELTLSKALIELLPIQRVVIASVLSQEGQKRWLEAARLDAGGGGRVADPLRVDFQTLSLLEDAPDRVRCLQSGGETVEVAWAGEDGPRITIFPLYVDTRMDNEGVLEIHSGSSLSEESHKIIAYLLGIYRNMYGLLQYSDRDALTGLLNRKSLDDAFYNAVLQELDGVLGDAKAASLPNGLDQERRHRVPPNYWLGTVTIDHFSLLGDKHGQLIAEEVILLVARILNNTFRTHDLIYRFGAEHFAVLFHCPEEALAVSAFERFRSAMERFNFPQVGRVTASCGFTNIMVDDSPSTALERCERAVEFAQKSGFNKVFSHLDLVRRGLFEESPKVGGVELF